MDEWMRDEWMDGWREGRTDGRTNGCMDEVDRQREIIIERKRDREFEREETEREKERETGVTERQPDRRERGRSDRFIDIQI